MILLAEERLAARAKGGEPLGSLDYVASEPTSDRGCRVVPEGAGPDEEGVAQPWAALDTLDRIEAILDEKEADLRAFMAEQMNLLPMVTWDRYAGSGSEFDAYGWIPRRDGQRDFVVLQFNRFGVGFITSSAKYSAAISTILNGGVPSATHNECVRVAGSIEGVRKAVEGVSKRILETKDGVTTILGCPVVIDETVTTPRLEGRLSNVQPIAVSITPGAYDLMKLSGGSSATFAIGAPGPHDVVAPGALPERVTFKGSPLGADFLQRALDHAADAKPWFPPSDGGREIKRRMVEVLRSAGLLPPPGGDSQEPDQASGSEGDAPPGLSE